MFPAELSWTFYINLNIFKFQTSRDTSDTSQAGPQVVSGVPQSDLHQVDGNKGEMQHPVLLGHFTGVDLQLVKANIWRSNNCEQSLPFLVFLVNKRSEFLK